MDSGPSLPSEKDETGENEVDRKRASPTAKRFILVAVIVSIASAYFFLGDALTLDSLAKREVQLRGYQMQHPYLVLAIAFVVYVIVTGLSLPGAAVLSLVYGWYFGFLTGFFLISFASTTGATVAFLLSRYLLRDWIEQKFGDKLKSFNDNLRREGAFYLFTLRLIPLVPFFVINVVMGLTAMRTWTFWWVSQLGMLAGTAVYVNAGSSFPSLAALAQQGAQQGAGGIVTFKLVLSFLALGLFPLFGKMLLNMIRRNHAR